MSPWNHALFDSGDLNGLCSYGNKLLAGIVLSFSKVPLTMVPWFSLWLWLSKTGSQKCQGYSGQRESEWLGKCDQDFFHLFPNPGLDWSNPSRKRLLDILPASMAGCGGCSRVPCAPPWLLSVCPEPRGPGISPAAAGISGCSSQTYLCACISQPGGVTAKILAVSATLRLCLRSHFCSCACLHLILFALTSMQMQQQAQAVRCSLYYYVFFSLQSLLASKDWVKITMGRGGLF